MRVVVVLENFVYDEHIAHPILQRIFKELGIQARIIICKYPFLGGISQALSTSKWDEIILVNPMTNLFILMVDRDGVQTRHQVLENIESHVASQGKKLISSLAIEEFETWLLSGVALDRTTRWTDIRRDISVKENWFYPLSERRGLIDEPDEGRKTLMREAMPHYNRMEALCPEIRVLKEEIERWHSQ